MASRLLIEQLPDGQVSVSFRRDGQEFDEVSGKPIAFASPLGQTEREDFRWYLEDYLLAPYAVYEDRGQAIRAKLGEWGRALFDSVFGPGKPGRDAYLKAHEGACALVLRSPSSEFMGLPWELIRDPERQTPLALDLRAIDRTLQAAGAAAPVPPGKTLRVLMVIARPSGPKDVGYQMIARPLMERLGAVRGEVRLEVLRPPTFEAMRQRLKAAAEAGEPFHILHFDGHGTFAPETGGGGGSGLKYDAKVTGYLVFEPEGGGDDFVSADKFAPAVTQGRVPLVVMNACQSGMLGEAAVEAAVATRVLEDGASSVVAMGYSVYAVAAAEFMAAFYEALFSGQTVSEAVSEGRRRLYERQDRPSPKGPLPLEDWMVPVHYLRRSIGFAELKASRSTAAPSLDKLLDKLRPSAPQPGGAEQPAEQKDLLAPVGRFVGRDIAFYTLELALKWQRVVVVHGPAGTGKTELAKAFGRWWKDTGGVDNPAWVFFHSFEPGLASFGLDGVVTEIGLRLFGSDFVGRTQDAAHRCQVVQQLLCEHRLLLIWDNFESVFTLPDLTGGTPSLDEATRARMRNFLHAVAQNGKSGVIITSRTKEEWLGNIRPVELGGLTPPEAAEMAEDMLRPYPVGRTRRKERAFAELLEWLDGHPLSIRLLLPHLEQISAGSLLAALKGQTQNLPPGFVGEGRTESLGASLRYSFDHLAREMRERAWALALFEGVADEQLLGWFSAIEGMPARFAGVTMDEWSALLTRLASIGVLTALGGGMYALHPALPSYLTAEWRVCAGAGFAAEQEAAEGGLLAAYAAFGDWLLGQIQGGAAEVAFALLERQRRTMGRLLGFALGRKRFAEAKSVLQPLNRFWVSRGLTQETRGWLDRCRAVLEGGQGTAPDPSSEAGELWFFVVFRGANRALEAGDLEAAYRDYDAIRQWLEASPGSTKKSQCLAKTYHQLGLLYERLNPQEAAKWYRKSLKIKKKLGDRSGIATSYHGLGVLAQNRDDLDEAERYYTKSLEIRKMLRDLPAIATSYHQLGIAAQRRSDLAAAEGWYRKSLEIEEALGNRLGMASSYHQLGMVARHRGDLGGAEGWYRKSLEILEELPNLPLRAFSYGALGSLAEAREDAGAALDWTVRCIALFAEFPHPATGPGPGHLARLTALLGLPALEESWLRCTGAVLPDHIRAGVVTMMRSSETRGPHPDPLPEGEGKAP